MLCYKKWWAILLFHFTHSMFDESSTLTLDE